MKLVQIKPILKRAKNRVNEHGDTFKLVVEDTFNGIPAILVRAKEGDWMGWLDKNECTWTL
jgi:hypothetical protein